MDIDRSIEGKAKTFAGWTDSIRLAIVRLILGREKAAKALAGPKDTSLPLDEYVASMPHAQNSIDLVPGWNHAFPPDVDVQAGAVKLYADPRIVWALEQYGDISGKRILELGPLEASHTYMLDKQRPALIHAVEANKLSFMRCLIAKNLLGLNSAQFLLGDFHKWLEACPDRYELIVASGVLYHMVDPVHLLDLMSQRSDALYLWTHYYGEAEMPEGDTRRLAFSGKVPTRPFRGLDVKLHKRSYHGAWRDKSFCGGMYDEHSWMEKDQIVAVLNLLGYDDVQTAHDNWGNPHGPCISIFARRIR